MVIKLLSYQLVEKGVIIGHNRKFREKQMNFSLTITKNWIDYFSTYRILEGIRKTETILTAIGFEEGVFFVGTQNTAAFMILKMRARETLFHFVSEKWKGGTISNFKQLRKSIVKYLVTQEGDEEILPLLTKKEILSIYQRYKDRTYFEGITELEQIPDLIFSGSVKKDHYMIWEGNLLEIPVIGIVDSDTKPSGVSYVIPGNDESVESILVILNFCLKYFESGLKMRITRFFLDYVREKRKREEIKRFQQRFKLFRGKSRYPKSRRKRWRN